MRDFAVVAGPLPDAEVCASCLAGEDVAQCGSGCGLLVCTQRSKQCREGHRRECQLLTESGLKVCKYNSSVCGLSVIFFFSVDGHSI